MNTYHTDPIPVSFFFSLQNCFYLSDFPMYFIVHCKRNIIKKKFCGSFKRKKMNMIKGILWLFLL